MLLSSTGMAQTISAQRVEQDRSLFLFSQIVARGNQMPLKELVRILEEAQLEPKVFVDQNPYTGTMKIVRTQRRGAGVRYFHAQYFSPNMPQHISFEFVPGQDSMARVQSSLGNLLRPMARIAAKSMDYAKWNVTKGYNLWIKRMGPEDLGERPFNAYSIRDVGTVRVVFEAEVHGEL